MMKKRLFFIPLFIMASGCASKVAPLPESLPFSSAPDWELTDFVQLSNQVIEVDRYSELQQYIVQVIGNNPDLKSLSATARAASYNVNIAKAENRPRADLNLAGTRSKDALQEIGNTASVGIDVNWSMDIWGKLSDDADAARYLSDKTRYELQQLRRVLINRSARLWVEYRASVRAEKHLITINKFQKNVVGYYQDAYHAGVIPFSYYQGAFQVGLVPYEFLLDAKNSLKRTQSRLQEVQLEKRETLQLMNILRGRLPGDALVVTDDDTSLKLPSLPEQIPATALQNRPDIQAEFSEFHAFRRSERAAYKALLPRVNITASTSKSGTTLEKALRGDFVWQLIGGLTQPLFNSGQLRAIARQKSAEAEASWWQYQNTVLRAMQEVESAMASDKLLAWQLKQKQAELDNLVEKKGSAEQRFADGDLSLSDYLLIKTEHVEAQIELNNIKALYIKNRLALIVALGLPLDMLVENSAGENSDEQS